MACAARIFRAGSADSVLLVITPCHSPGRHLPIGGQWHWRMPSAFGPLPVGSARRAGRALVRVTERIAPLEPSAQFLLSSEGPIGVCFVFGGKRSFVRQNAECELVPFFNANERLSGFSSVAQQAPSENAC
jgi:hypothetical protein